MKIVFLLAYAVLTSRKATCAAIQAPIDLISLDDITESDRKHLEFLNTYYNPSRSKRSGEDALNHLKASLGHGLKSKLGLIAKSSASASSHFSSSSSSSSSGHDYHHHHHHHDHPEFYDHKSFDFWSLKKSILNTLLQAVKAIKGGVIAIKGQLIKGSGYLISAKGKLISAKGEAITNLGKNIATSAILSPTHGHSDEYSHGHYHHTAPEEYGSPSAPGPEYEVPEHHYHHHSPHHEDKPDADHAGILILKKIPKHEHTEHLPVEHKVPDFKPIGHSGPSLGEIIGKFFSASTSLKPGVPAPFGDHYDHDHHHEHYHSDHDHDHDHHHDHDEHYHDHSSHSHTEYHHETHPSSHGDEHHEYTHSDSSDHEHDKPSSNYGSPFEEAPSFLNLEEYASESKKQQQTVTQAPTPEPQKSQNPIKYDEIRPLSAFASPDAQKLQSNPIKYDEIRPLSTGFSNTGVDTSYLLNTNNKPNLFVGTYSNKPNTAFPPYPPQQLPSIKPTALAVDTTSLQFGGFPNTGVFPTSGSDIKYLAPPGVGPQVFPSGVNTQSHAYPQSVRYHGLLDSFPSPSHKTPLKRPTRSKNHHHGRKRPILPSPEFMKQLMYKVGHDGPKRL